MKVSVGVQRAATRLVAPTVTITTAEDDELDWSGLTSMKLRLQLGAADELEMTLPAQNPYGDNEMVWRPDMPCWQVGATVKVSAGYDGTMDHLQTFEIVSTTNNYGSGEDAPEMTVRGVSDLARAARNRNPRTYDGMNDFVVLDALCAEYGWTNGVTEDQIGIEDQELDMKSKFTKSGRVKKGGTTDLEMLKLIATGAKIGGPRLDRDKVLVMPSPNSDFMSVVTFVRGAISDDSDAYQLLSFSPSREGGAENTQLSIVAWDPEKKAFIEKVYEPDEFGGEPKIMFDGTLSASEITEDMSTRGLTLQVTEARGYNKDERRSVVASGRFMNETDAGALAKRWFDLREKVSRWCTLEVDGHPALVPYTAVIVDGELAKMDKGYWLPTVVEHNFGTDGWTTSLTCIRVVDDTTVKEAE